MTAVRSECYVEPEEIRAARKAAGLTQAEAARVVRAGSYRTWQDWESGRRKMPELAWLTFKIKVEEMNMNTQKINAVVYPLVAGDGWLKTEPPIPLVKDSKAEAIRALKKRGYTIMWKGGNHDKYVVNAEELRSSCPDDADVMEAEREIGYSLEDDKEITKYVITVHPN